MERRNVVHRLRRKRVRIVRGMFQRRISRANGIIWGGGGGGRNSYKGRVRGEHSEGITTKKEKNVGRKNQ